MITLTLTCARLDAHWVDGCQLQAGHQLIWLVLLLGLALVVPAVDATASRVSPQIRPPGPRSPAP